MLQQLTIANFALVAHLDIHLAPGLTVITGESGAGKSIILDALGLVLGDRARAGLIRPGTERTEVAAQFDLEGRTEPQTLLADNELTDPEDPDACLLRRVVTADGRSRAFVNGSPVTLGILRQIADALVEVHGQQDHQRLSDKKTQLAMLDDFGTRSTDQHAMRQAYRAWQEAVRQADTLRASLDAQADRAALITYQLEELDGLGLREGEFEQLESDFRRLSQAQQLLAVVQQAQTALEEDSLRTVASRLGNLRDEHPDLKSALDACRSALSLLDDAAADLRHYEDSLQVEDAELRALEERLSAIHDLARKHRVAPESLVAQVRALQEELAGLATSRSALTTLEMTAAEQREAFEKAAAKVSRQRRKAAPAFAEQVSGHLETLGIRGGALEVRLTPAEAETGLESAEFYVTTNPKYPAGPLADIASGGEQTRINLAIAIVAAERTALPCLVLDEADVGVGGTTADVVGRLLRGLGRHTQVICITHAPQVAALGDQHLRVVKTREQDTQLEPLSPGHRIDELARMLAGADVTDKTRDYASTLLAEATLHSGAPG